MYRYKIFNLIIFVLLLSITSCNDDDKSIYETGQKEVSLVKSNNESTLEVIVDPAQRSQIALQAEIDNLSAFGIVAEVETKASLIEEYNQKHGTNYQELPPSSYSFETTEFIFPKYSEVSSHVNITLSSVGMDSDVEYLLPIQMILLKGDPNASISTNGDIVYLIVSKLPPPALIHLKDVELTTEIGPDKKNWFSAYATNSEGGHTFSIEEAAEQSHMMDFVLLKFGRNLRLHTSYIGWQHGGDYYRYLYPYINGFKKLTHTANMNRLFTPTDFDAVNSSEEMTSKIEELKNTSGYNFYVADRMTSHNLQSQIEGDNRVLIQGTGAKVSVNTQFYMLYIKEVTPINGGEDYKIKFDAKYIDVDVRTETLKTEGQNVIIDNPSYDPSNEMVEYKGIELTTEIGPNKKNWFSAYADKDNKTFTQEEAKGKSNMMDFTPVLHSSDEVRLYSAFIGYQHASYKDRIAPYTNGFSKITYMMLSGWRSGSADATKLEHYENVSDVQSMTQLIIFYNKTYGYPIADRMLSDKLEKDKVGVIGWGNRDQETGNRFNNNRFGIYVVRDVQPTAGGHYKVILDIKVPKTDARTPNNKSMVNNPG